MLARLRALAQARADFAFETTLASRSFARWLVKLASAGYRVHLTFLSLPDADLAVARVAERVLQGGHSVPEPVVRRRFAAGLRNFFRVYRNIVDTWQVFDNAVETGPRLIATGRRAQEDTVVDLSAWTNLVRRGRS